MAPPFAGTDLRMRQQSVSSQDLTHIQREALNLTLIEGGKSGIGSRNARKIIRTTKSRPRSG